MTFRVLLAPTTRFLARVTLGFSFLFLSVAACAGAQQVDLPIRDALLAQVDGPGGCFGEIQSIAPIRIRFFPQVDFYLGSCILEHGDTARPLAAKDHDGVIYVLDSRSEFRLLIRRHPPIGLDTTSAMEYAKDALTMMGEMPYEAAISFHSADLPGPLCSRLTNGCSGFYESRIKARDARNGLLTLVMTAYTQKVVYSAGPIVVEPNGSVIGGVHEYY